MSGFKKVRNAIMQKLGIYGHYCILGSQYLKHTGWFRSVNTGRPVDADGQPVPWITYPAISFLSRHINSQMSVFEYGSGASTLWWATRVKEVISCEHDQEWYQHIKTGLPPNATIHFFALEYGGDYSRKICDYKGRFDIVVIDGRDRVRCARNAVEALKRDGVIVWDNSDREEYREGLDYLASHGFRRIDFAGMTPLIGGDSETSVLYRTENCLGI